MATRFVAYAALDDFIPLYPVYALLFADSGLTAAQISTLFVIWSVTTFVLEVPSGALADVVSRRLVLTVSSVVSALGFGLWVVAPSYPAFAVGFMLWGASSALASGTYEAMAYEALDECGLAPSYARLMGIAEASALGLNLLATMLAVPLMALGGYALTGAVSVAVCLAQAVVALSVPDVRRGAANQRDGGEASETNQTDETEEAGYFAMLRAGVTEAGRSRVLRNAVLLVAVLYGFLAFDEYFPLLARDVGASMDVLPLLIAFTVAAQAAGSLVAGRVARWPGRRIGGLTGLAGGLIALGALWAEPLGFVPIGVGYGMLQAVLIAAEARMQDVITGPARATATSVAGFLAEVWSVAIFVGFAVGSAWLTVSVLVAALTLPVLATAFVLPRLLPPRRPRGDPPPAAVR